MTEIQKYLAEEVAEDLADGIITRREAMRRLGLLGLSGAAATALLAAFAGAPAPAATRRRGRRDGETDWAAVPTEAITFAGPRGPLMAAWAEAEKPRGGVLVIHENRGLTATSPPSRAGSRPAATPRWRSTCSPRRAAPARSPARPRSRPRSAASIRRASTPT